MTEYDMNTLTTNVMNWAMDKGLDEVDPANQLMVTMEELGELASALRKNKPVEEVMDGIGDTIVTLMVVAVGLGLHPRECLQYAWDQIKDRKGEMRNGTFVKESDL